MKLLVPSSSSSLWLASARPACEHLHRSSAFLCFSARNRGVVPKLEPFTPTYFQRTMKSPSFVERTRKDISDYCLTLEGDDCCSCWEAYFELGALQKDWPETDIERLLLLEGGLKSVIGRVHRASTMPKPTETPTPVIAAAAAEDDRPRRCPIPDGIPKSQEELEEEEKARMPETAYTRLLRAKGKYPAWYTPLPDHETD